MSQTYTLHKARICDAIDRMHLSQAGFADELGLSRCHWSQVLNGRRPATPKLRRALLRHPALHGVPEAELWQVRATQCKCALAPPQPHSYRVGREG